MPFASNWYPFKRPSLVSFQRPLTAEASGGRCGTTDPFRVESRCWHVANRGRIIGMSPPCEVNRLPTFPRLLEVRVRFSCWFAAKALSRLAMGDLT